MKTFRVVAVGQPDGPPLDIEAHTAADAVAQAARCDMSLVGLPIWRAHRDRFDQQRYEVECYMPRDDSGRQWRVSEVQP